MEEIGIKKRGKIFLITLILGVIIILNCGFAVSASVNTSNLEGSDQLTTDTTTNYAEGSNSTKTIKVLIYSGSYAAYSCVNGIKTSLNLANINNLVPGYNFTYATSTVINSATLSGYDVLAMPGGSSGYDYLHSSGISGTAIKNFIASGKGYVGICAGAYSGSYRVYDYYYGWGVAPNVNCTHPNHEGNLKVQITSYGEQILGTTGTVTMVHYNGPAMKTSGNAIVFATYADDIINSKGMGAIVGDFYGKGRTVLCGPHPELDPQLPGIVANMFAWAANSTINPDPEPTVNVTLSQVASAAATVKSYYDKNKVLPSSVNINGNQISMAQFAFLLAKGIININNSYTSSITVKDVKNASAPSGTYKSGTLQKSTFINMANSLVKFVNNYGRAPNYQTTSLGKISFNKLVYMYSKIMSFYKTNKRLPNFVSI
ncbi:MAG: BPL-N domain-containing protein [Methanobacterium sp.]|nr:BPL-N domain-containing protein [Methanobacterium sp.]